MKIAPDGIRRREHRIFADCSSDISVCFEDAYAPQDLSPSSKAFEDVYQLGKKIGDGGFGTVHIARNIESENDVAVKVIDKR